MTFLSTSSHTKYRAIKLFCALWMSLGSFTAQAAEAPVKVVVTAAFVSESGISIYKKITDYISKKLGVPVSIVSGTSYKESQQLLKHGVIQMGFVCGLPYTHELANNNVELVAIPVMSMKQGRFADAPGYEDIPGKYYSYTIVHKNANLKSWQDLKGKRYAYNDQNSNSGYNMPRYKLVQLGARSWDEYFSNVVISGSHEESIRLVAQGVVDASSVDSLVLDYDRHLGRTDALNVKIIESLFPGGAGIPPVVISSKAPAGLKEKLTDILVNMHRNELGKRILALALLSRFDAPNDQNYNDIRRMEQAARQAGFRDPQ